MMYTGPSNEKLYDGLTFYTTDAPSITTCTFIKYRTISLPGFLKNEIPKDILHFPDTRHHNINIVFPKVSTCGVVSVIL